MFALLGAMEACLRIALFSLGFFPANLVAYFPLPSCTITQATNLRIC